MSTSHKRQIWLRPDQVELTADVLKYAKARCEERNNLDSGVAVVAKRFVVRRLDEVLALLEPKQD